MSKRSDARKQTKEVEKANEAAEAKKMKDALKRFKEKQGR